MIMYNLHFDVNDKYLALTFTHEMGHSFGAKHDTEYCCPTNGSRPYIMTKSFNGLSYKNYPNKFSPCSLDAMKEKTLDIFQQFPETDCFVDLNSTTKSEVEKSVCGNKKIESGEECDCGMTLDECNGAKCYPGIIPDELRLENELAIEVRLVKDSALPCTYRKILLSSEWQAFIYGIVLPFSVMVISVLFIAVCLTLDWKGRRFCFSHITQNNVRIN